METKQAITVLDKVEEDKLARYTEYTRNIIPATNEEVFKRWLFTYASVHTTWKYNCILYKELKDLTWVGDEKELKKRIIKSRAGFHNNRTKFISQFTDFYWSHPGWFRKTKHESWLQYRDRVQEMAPGVGVAKSAFVCELINPAEAEIVCVDTHILQLYGYTPSFISKRGVRDKDIKNIEKHWIEQCVKRGVSPVLARWLYWDRKQGQSDSRYWTFVFEEVNFNDKFAELVADSKQLHFAF